MKYVAKKILISVSLPSRKTEFSVKSPYLQHQVAEGWLQQSEFNYLTFNYPPFNETSGTLTCTSYSEATAEPTDCVNHYWTVIQFNYNYKGRIYKSEWSGLTITYTYEEDLSENYPYKSIKVPNDTVFGCLDVSCLPQPMTAEELDEKYEDIKLPELCSDVSLEMKMNIELMDADGCHKEYKEWYTLKDYCTGLILYEIEHTVVLYDGLDISGTLEPFTYAPCDGTPTDEHANIDYLVSQGLVLGPDVDKNNITVTYHDMPDEEYPYYFTRAFFIRSTSCPKAKEEIVLQDYKPDYVYCFDELTPGEEYEICSKEDFDATLPQNKASAMAFLIFILIYFPCIATVMAIASELGWKWAVGSIVYSTTIAWIVAYAVYNLINLLL